VSAESNPGSLGTLPIDRFLDELASPSPTPGGGGIAALAGAMAAGLVSMVCHLTIGKERYADVQDQVKELLQESDQLRHRLHELVDEDASAYDQVMAAYRLPRSTDDEKRARSARIQEASIEASRVPLEAARECARVIDLCMPAARITNVQAIGDVAMAAYLAEGAIRGLADNIDINLRSVKNQEVVDELNSEARRLTEGLSEKVLAAVQAGMARL
jgi:methenyltetrahydrofolate cyclohydrolase